MLWVARRTARPTPGETGSRSCAEIVTVRTSVNSTRIAKRERLHIGTSELFERGADDSNIGPTFRKRHVVGETFVVTSPAMLHLGSIGGTSIDVDFNFVFLVLF